MKKLFFLICVFFALNSYGQGVLPQAEADALLRTMVKKVQGNVGVISDATSLSQNNVAVAHKYIISRLLKANKEAALTKQSVYAVLNSSDLVSLNLSEKDLNVLKDLYRELLIK